MPSLYTPWIVQLYIFHCPLFFHSKLLRMHYATRNLCGVRGCVGERYISRRFKGTCISLEIETYGTDGKRIYIYQSRND